MSIADRKSEISASSLTAATRSALRVLIEHEERRVGSREVAFGIVAKTVGASSSWLKKFLVGHVEVKEPRITLFLRIRVAYEELCNRVEQEHQREAARIEALRGQLNASVEGFVELVEGTSEETGT